MPYYLLFLSDKVHLVAITAIFKVQHSGLENRSINVRALCPTIVPLEIHRPPHPHPRVGADCEFSRTQGILFSTLNYALFTMQHAICTMHLMSPTSFLLSNSCRPHWCFPPPWPCVVRIQIQIGMCYQRWLNDGWNINH